MTSRLLVAAVLAPCLAACGGSSSQGDHGSGSFAIQGQIGTASPALGSQSLAIAPSDVKTVVAFSAQGDWWQADVTTGSFKIHVDPTAPVGLVFAGASGQYLGHLALPGGFVSLPLQAAASGVQSIDLGTLVASADAVESGHDPLAAGAEIPLLDSDKSALLYAESLFASVVRNPDVDGSGVVDALEGRLYRSFIMYFVGGGNFGGGHVGIPATPAAITGFRFSVQVNESGATFPDTVTFTGPLGAQIFNGETNPQAAIRTADSAMYGSAYVGPSGADVTGPAIPPAGDYLVGLGSRTLTFHVPDQSSATSELAVAVPTVTLNGDGTIAKIGWSYRLGDGSGTVDPRALIHDLIVQIDGNGDFSAAPRCAANGGVNAAAQGNRVYNSPQLTPDVTEHTLACQNIAWAAVTQIYMAYNDVYGNHVVVQWQP